MVQQQLATLGKGLTEKRLSVKVEKIEGEYADLNLDVLLLHVLALAGTQDLEGKNALLFPVPCHSFTVEDKRFGIRLGKL